MFCHLLQPNLCAPRPQRLAEKGIGGKRKSASGEGKYEIEAGPKDEVFREVIINDCPSNVRFHLTKRNTQDDVSC